MSSGSDPQAGPSVDHFLVTDPDILVEHYRDVPTVHIYALADLEEPFWSASQWYRRNQAVVGLVQIPGDEAKTVYAVATRQPNETLALVIDLLPRLPPGTLITGPVGLADAVGDRRQLAWGGPHLRYCLVGGPTRAPQWRTARRRDRGTWCLANLGPAHADQLDGLYATEPEAAFFRRSMLVDDSFAGVFDDGELVAAAGTHVLSGRHGVAAIGAIYTLPSHRGRGLGRLVTQAVIDRIADRVPVIGLNVAEGNTPARRIYGQLGFEPILAYEEVALG